MNNAHILQYLILYLWCVCFMFIYIETDSTWFPYNWYWIFLRYKMSFWCVQGFAIHTTYYWQLSQCIVGCYVLVKNTTLQTLVVSTINIHFNCKAEIHYRACDRLSWFQWHYFPCINVEMIPFHVNLAVCRINVIIVW